MFADKSVKEFTAEAASKAPVPGGGGVSALVGALGIALGNMVGELTVGKKKYADVEEEICMLMEQAGSLRKELLDLIDEDAQAFEPLSKAYGIPKDDPARAEMLEQATRQACQPPLAIMQSCGKAIDLIQEFAAKGSRLAVSDAGCAAVLCQAAMQAAALNVYINTKSLADRVYAEELNGQVGRLLDIYCGRAEEIYADVKNSLMP